MRAILILLSMFVSLTAAFGRDAQPSTTPNVETLRPVGALGAMQESDTEASAFIVMMQAAASAQEDLKAIMAQVKAINEAKNEQRRRLAATSQLSSNPCAGTGGVAWRACALKIERQALRLHLGALNVMKAATVAADADTRAMFAAMNRARIAKIATRERTAAPDVQRTPCAETGVDAWRSCLARIEAHLAGNVIDDRSKAELDNLVNATKGDLDSMSEMGETESLRLQMAMDRLSKMMSTLSNLMKKMSDTTSAITQNLK